MSDMFHYSGPRESPEEPDETRRLYTMYFALSQHPGMKEYYPNRKLGEFTRWWQSLNAATQGKYLEQLRRDYEKHLDDTSEIAADILEEFMRADSEESDAPI